MTKPPSTPSSRGCFLMDRKPRLKDWIEAGGVALLFYLFKALPVRIASEIGGFLARTIGPPLGISRRADRSLAKAFPEMGAGDRRQALCRMWDNLGRTFAELPHISALNRGAYQDRVQVEGAEHLTAAQATGRRIIFFTGHFGNWEISKAVPLRGGARVTIIYRAPNNPIIDRLLHSVREADLEFVPKGRVAARGTMEALNEGRAVGFLIDQKLNDGIPVPFLGRDAMTAPVLARLALRYDCAVLPVRVDRLPGARFRVTCEPALDYEKTGDTRADTFALMRQCNAVLERWVRERPDQWFWLHRRWPD